MNQHFERLDGCFPVLRAVALQFIELSLRKLAIPLLVVTGWRSVQDQMKKYQQGRIYDQGQGIWLISDPDQVITDALPGRSAHNVVTVEGKPASLAVDVIPLDDAGQAEWNTPMPTWEALYALAWTCGLDPLGDQKGEYLKGDWGHFQIQNWKAVLDAWGLVQPSSLMQNV